MCPDEWTAFAITVSIISLFPSPDVTLVNVSMNGQSGAGVKTRPE